MSYAALAVSLLGAWNTSAWGAEAATPNVEEIVVTGSYIKGSAEDAALPVDTITQQDMVDQGSPNMIEMVRQLGVTSGNLGQTNQFQGIGQGNEGVVSINLRGLGAARTLTLINGRRQVATESNGVDVSIIPTSALARTEVLLGGAAATYGSDAIAGVVNFITRGDFEGFEIGASNQWVQDSVRDFGNQQYNAIWGMGGEQWNVMVAAEYDYMSEIHVKDRDWALQPFAKNPAGGWSSIGNPGSYYPAIPTANNLPPPTATGLPSNAGLLGGASPDPGCEVVGGVVVSGTCRFQYTFFDNLQEKTETSKLFTEFNYDVSDATKFHVEALYSYLDLPNGKTSPGYPPQSLFGPDRWIAPNHPGLVAMKAANPTMFNTLFGIPGDAQATYSQSRYLGVSGLDGHPQNGSRRVNTYRLGTSLTGSLFEEAISYDVGITYSSRNRVLEANDMYVERMAFALDGLGGPGCTPGGANAATSTPGTGPCEYYNPFSNAFAFSAVTGRANPNYDPAVANSSTLLHWMYGGQKYTEQSDLLTWDAVISGETPWTLPGGTVAWAAGLQVRNEKYDLSLNRLTDLDKTPCPFVDPYSITLGNTKSLTCASPTGPFAFLAGATQSNTSRNVYAAFTEFSLPITDTIDAQFAMRYEDYGSDVGSTVDPKIGIRWQALDWLALRGSATTTFRGPPQSYLSGQVTALVFITPTSAFKAVNNIGNADLGNESATTSSLGFIVNAGGFTATVDYWKYDLQDPFQTEDPNQIVNAYSAPSATNTFGQGCYDGGVGAPIVGGVPVPTANCTELRSHIVPTGTIPTGIERIDVHVINGSDISTSGVDATAQYDFEDVMNGELSFGLQGTYTIDYSSDDFKDIGGVTLAKGGDFVGKMNIGTPFTSLPDLKGNVWAKYVHGPHRLTYMIRYVSDYEDDTALTAALHDVDSMTYQDIYYNVTLFNDSTLLSLGVMNLTDEDPPKTSTNLNYDPYTADPFGRMIKLGIQYTFGPQK
jgi:iron complex outermembrane recepter protein